MSRPKFSAEDERRIVGRLISLYVQHHEPRSRNIIHEISVRVNVTETSVRNWITKKSKPHQVFLPKLLAAVEIIERGE
jgi:hypothetical protein